MAVRNEEDGKWSNSKAEGDEGLRTVECLRGRLLAERQASRVAKEDAELMGNKLIELEIKLREEAKLKKNAEKRLNFLKKKLESLNIFPALEESEQSSSSESSSCLLSCGSSTSILCSKNPEESDSSVFQITASAPEISQKMEENASEISTSLQMQSFHISQSEENPSSPDACESEIKDPSHDEKSSDKSTSICEVSKLDDDSQKASPMEMDTNGRNESDNDDDYVDNSLALVPMDLPEETKPDPEIKIVSKSVAEVLDALRHARERIQSSMERRQHMIRVGPCGIHTC